MKFLSRSKTNIYIFISQIWSLKIIYEINFYFLMKSRGTQVLNSHSSTLGIPEHMAWLPMNALDQYEAYPMFFRTKLKNIKTSGFEHIITRG